MKNFSFYWNWLARVAKSSGVQRKAVVKSATSKAPINGKTAILTVATILAIALTTPITGTSAQSAEIPELPDLPDPGPVPEPAFPPVPPGTFTCFEYYEGMRQMLENGQANFYQAIERTYNAKCKPFYDAKDAIFDERDRIFEQMEKLNEEWGRLYMSPNSGSAANIARRRQINKELAAKSLRIKKLQEETDTINERLGEIGDWREKVIKWANEKHQKENEALEAHYQDCLANEQDDD